MNIKKNFLLFLCFWLSISFLSLQANDFIDACLKVINVTTNAAIDHLKANGPKYVVVAISAGIYAGTNSIVANVINKRSNAIDSKLSKQNEIMLIKVDAIQNQNEVMLIKINVMQNQLETMQQIQENQSQQLDFYQKREAVQQAYINFQDCLLETNKDYKACDAKRKISEQANDKLLNDILNHSNIKEVL